MNIGFDLGTTNSSICYFSNDKNAYEYLHFDGNHLDYFPSMITYRPNMESPLIGIEARKKMHIKGAHYFLGREIKLNIGSNTVIRNKPIFDLLRDQIKVALDRFDDEKKNRPGRIVLTVPARWTESESDGNELAMLRQVFQELGYDTNRISFESEPVAAAAFFCHERMKDSFMGFCFILDYGGGTLDGTVCQIDSRNTIRILFKTGITGDNSTGCAGEAFDIEICRRMILNNQLDVPLNKEGEIDIHSKIFLKYQKSVEEGKIADTEKTTRALISYYSSKADHHNDKYDQVEAFEVCDPRDDENIYSITVEDVINTFEEINKRELVSLLQEVLAFCDEEKIDINNRDSFRIIPTGGFSNLFCVDQTICEVFNSKYGDNDLRFSQMLDRDIRSTAIAHGAAIIADNKVWVTPVCIENVGIKCYETLSEEVQEIIIIKKNDAVDDYGNPHYLERPFAAEWMSPSSCIELFSDSNPSVCIPVKDICPKAGEKSVEYRIGLSIIDGVVMIHSTDQENNEIIKSLEYKLRRNTNVING